MRPFPCDVCGQTLFFDNSVCLNCSAPVGYSPDDRNLFALEGAGDDLVAVGRPDRRFRHCANQLVARCNWLLPVDDPQALCGSCRLTTIRPADNDFRALAAFADTEGAKRRLLHQLTGLGLPVVSRWDDPQRGLAFEMLWSDHGQVVTGHKGGVITLDLSESDDAYREQVRQQLGEAYRTVLGHLRHEIAHYYWPLLVADGGRIDGFRALFGDERTPYEEAKQAHYARGPAVGWAATHVSQYATMHPWEDWAETFANYLHLRDGLDTAEGYGLTVGEPSRSIGERAAAAIGQVSVGPLVRSWLTLAIGLNAMSRSIGKSDLYPFVLPAPVVDKLEFVHRAVTDT